MKHVDYNFDKLSTVKLVKLYQNVLKKQLKLLTELQKDFEDAKALKWEIEHREVKGRYL